MCPFRGLIQVTLVTAPDSADSPHSQLRLRPGQNSSRPGNCHSMNTAVQTSGRRGFTLIELLV
ncbi:MAG: type II secretion system protein, partial [Catenulispora sp.]